MLLTRAGSSLAASWRSSLQGQLEGRLDQAIGEVGRRRPGRSFCSARGMLCHSVGWSAAGGCVHAHLQAAVGLDGHEAALEIHVGRLHAAQDGLGRLAPAAGIW